jgi:hypothetical protein
MSNKLKNVGRAKQRRRSRGPNFIQLYRYVLDSPAYVSLSANARSALIEINRGYNGANNGDIVLSVRSIAERMGCTKKTAGITLQELVEKGFIEERVKGAYSVKFRHATKWRLTDRRCDVTGAEQSKAFLKWQNPGPVSKPTPKTKTKTKPQKPTNHRSKNYPCTGVKITPLGNFPEQPPQGYILPHYKPFHGSKIYPTSISTSLERDVALPAAVPSAAGVEPAATGIGHDAEPPSNSSDAKPAPAMGVAESAEPNDLLEIPPFLRRA